MIAFVNVLSQLTQRIVIDRTGLGGLFQADLRWMPDAPATPAPTAPGGLDTPPPANSNGPTLTTALQEQLGLKLESRKSLVDLLVIDGTQRKTNSRMLEGSKAEQTVRRLLPSPGKTPVRASPEP
jgi:uncharacterized protein (TIGR03435 family)